jgi:hypothetical protein
MNQQADDKELKAAFAEFKELLKREMEPVGASVAPAVRLGPEAADAPHIGAASPAPRLHQVGAESFEPPPIAPAFHAVDDWSAEPSVEDFAPEGETSGGRRKLIYLSVAIVVIGLAGIGWTLSDWRATEEPAVADMALPAESEPAADQAALEPPVADSARDAAAATVTPTTEQAEVAPPAAETPASGPAPAAASTFQATASLPAVADPSPASSPERLEPVSPPPAASAAVAPVAAAAGAAVAPIASTGAGAVSRMAPPAAPDRSAALQPSNRFEPQQPAAPTAVAPVEPKPAAPAKVAKPKPKPPQATAKRAKPRNAAPMESAPVASAEPPAAPEPAPPPPPPPQNEGGAFGFMKRTINSVGSTIGGLGRSVMPH